MSKKTPQTNAQPSSIQEADINATSQEIHKEIIVKERILSAAVQQFMQFGFSRISMDDLAQQLGMSKKTLYHYFESKEALIREIVLWRMQKMTGIQQMLATKVSKNAFGSKIATISTTLATLISEVPIHVYHDLQKTYPNVYQEQEIHRKNCINTGFMALLLEGKEHGFFRNDIPNDVIVKIQTTVVTTLLTPEYIMNVPYTPEQLLKLIFQFTMGGICTAKGRQLMETSLFSNVQ